MAILNRNYDGSLDRDSVILFTAVRGKNPEKALKTAVNGLYSACNSLVRNKHNRYSPEYPRMREAFQKASELKDGHKNGMSLEDLCSIAQGIYISLGKIDPVLTGKARGYTEVITWICTQQ